MNATGSFGRFSRHSVTTSFKYTVKPLASNTPAAVAADSTHAAADAAADDRRRAASALSILASTRMPLKSSVGVRFLDSSAAFEKERASAGPRTSGCPGSPRTRRRSHDHTCAHHPPFGFRAPRITSERRAERHDDRADQHDAAPRGSRAPRASLLTEGRRGGEALEDLAEEDLAAPLLLRREDSLGVAMASVSTPRSGRPPTPGTNPGTPGNPGAADGPSAPRFPSQQVDSPLSLGARGAWASGPNAIIWSRNDADVDEEPRNVPDRGVPARPPPPAKLYSLKRSWLMMNAARRNRRAGGRRRWRCSESWACRFGT